MPLYTQLLQPSGEPLVMGWGDEDRFLLESFVFIDGGQEAVDELNRTGYWQFQQPFGYCQTDPEPIVIDIQPGWKFHKFHQHRW